MNNETVDQEEIEIESVMHSIRKQIMVERGATTDKGEPIVNLIGDRVPAEFYDHLYQAAMDFNLQQMPLQLPRSRIPVLGSLADKLRFKIHHIVLFYVNRQAVMQSGVNLHLLRAASILGEQVEALAERAALRDRQ